MSEELLDIEINGRALKARKGAMIIEVADEAGLLIPRFCYHKKLSIAANCRMCLVEVEKAPKPLPACATPVMPGMKIKTKSALALRAQKSVMEFLLINHPLDCPICDQGGECELQDVAMGYGRDVSRFHERKRVVEDKNLGSLIATDMTRCIHCTRCVRFGTEIGGMPELGLTGRGENVRIGTFIEQSVNSELSGNVIDVCPVGALTSKPFRFRARAWEINQRDSVSPHDAVGSNLHIHIKNGKVVRVVPKENELVNEVWLSDRDRFSYQGLYSPDRLLSPLIKQDGEWIEADWATAIEATAKGLQAALSSTGPEKLGALMSPSVTTEEAYLLQKLVRGLGSNNIDHRLRRADFKGQQNEPLMPTLGATLAELQRNDCTLLIGSDCRRDQPMVNHRLRKSTLRGARVCVLNSVDYQFNYDVFETVIVNPAEMVRALGQIAVALNVDGACLQGLEVSPETTRIAQSLQSAERASIILGNAAQASPYASELRALAGVIAAQTGATFGVLSEGANAAGVALAGGLPHRTVGGHPVTPVGLDASAMLAIPMKAWVLMGTEPELDCHDGGGAMRALQSAQFVVGLVSHVSDTMRQFADVLLPLAPFAENAGTYINAQGDRQRFAEAVPASGESRMGWKILRVLGNALEIPGFDYVDLEGVLADISVSEGQTPTISTQVSLPEKLPSGNGQGLWRLGDMPIYAVDTLVRRAHALQATALAAYEGVRLNAATRLSLGLADAGRVRVTQGADSISCALVEDASIGDGCIHVAAGIVETAKLGPCYGPVELAEA